jgi:CheY-like chemotaxis protein
MAPDSGRADTAPASLRDLVRHIGHDLNNHLASIIVHLSLASSSRATPEERQVQIDEAMAAARQAAQLARELFSAGLETQPFVDMALTMEPQEARAAEEPGVTPRAVLVLEDDESVATMMKDVLKHFGYDVAVTQSPETCVMLYDDARQSGRPFDLVVLDLTIHGGHRRGVDTLAALRMIDPDVRAVAHSGDIEAEIMKDPRRHGFVGAICKPTPLAQLSRLVQTLIEKDA